MTTTQSRIYQLSTVRDEQDRWLVWWGNVRVLRERHGFRVVTAVIDPDRGVFTWLVEHDGDFIAAEQAMMASPEHAAIFALSRPANSIIQTAVASAVSVDGGNVVAAFTGSLADQRAGRARPRWSHRDVTLCRRLPWRDADAMMSLERRAMCHGGRQG